MVSEKFKELYEQKYSDVKRYFLKNFRGNESLAEDLTQDCFFKLMKHCQIYGDRDTNKNYLFKMAQNVKFDYIKAKVCEVPEEIMNVVVVYEIDMPLACDIEFAVDGLTAAEKIILSLLVNGFKSHEIAKTFNLTPSAVRARISKIKAKMKAKIR